MSDQQGGDRNIAAEIAALSELLDTVGANDARWPDGASARFGPLIATEAAASRLVAQARALDEVLAAAPRVSEARRSDLAARLVAVAEARLGSVAEATAAPERGRPDTVVRFPGGERARKSAPSVRRNDWQAAALLAASLLIGVFVGASGAFDTSLSGLSRLAGLTGEPDSFELALEQSSLPVFDEDAL